MTEGLVYVGKVVELADILGADFIRSATVVCGHGGKWRGIVRKDEVKLGDRCLVYLPDSCIPPNDSMKFMEASGWRVKMRRFKGSPSEVLIMPLGHFDMEVGTDLTEMCGVTKYMKPIPANLQGNAKGNFPDFIPKTDEPNYQRHEDLVEFLRGKPYYITVKYDGSSTTAYKYKGEFGICSRNLELVWNENNGYCQIAERYHLRENLPEGIALQWETCGPKIQGNPHGFSRVEGFAFSAYNILEYRYLDVYELMKLCVDLKFPMVEILDMGGLYLKDTPGLGEGAYANGHQREGVVVRSCFNEMGHKPISFKVINLNYEK